MFKLIDDDFLYNDRHRIYVSKVNGNRLFTKKENTRFIMCNGDLKSEKLNFSGIFAASINEEFEIVGNGIVIDLFGYNFSGQYISLIHAGMPGNLSYIDGCSNSNLVSPCRNGDPCLNYLYFPRSIKQTFHVHPSIRIGMIISGSGLAELNDQSHKLNVGDCFILDRFESHRFYTNESDMSLIAFHPDSDDGPTDEYNPMKSRTYIPK